MRKEWKKSLLVFKMSQRSIFECSVSKIHKADESDLADNAESVPKSASSDQPQQPTKKQKPSSATTGKTHSRFQDVWFDQFDWLEYDAQSKRMFCKVLSCREKQEHFLKWRCRCVYFCGVNAHFPCFVRLKNKKTRKDLMQTWKFKTKKKKNKKKMQKKKQEELTQSIQLADENY